MIRKAIILAFRSQWVKPHMHIILNVCTVICMYIMLLSMLHLYNALYFTLCIWLASSEEGTRSQYIL